MFYNNSILTQNFTISYNKISVFVKEHDTTNLRFDDFIWEFCDGRESLVNDLPAKKESMLQKEKDGTIWYFVKLRLSEDIHGTEIYEYNQEAIGDNPSLILPGTELEIPWCCY